MPANSFIASAEAVTLVGATPRFVDVDPETALVTRGRWSRRRSARARARSIPVHLYGRTLDLEPIMRARARVRARGGGGRLPGARRVDRRPPGRRDRRLRRRSRSTRPRTSAPGATQARSSRTTPRSPTAFGCSARTASGRATTTAIPGTTARLDALQAGGAAREAAAPRGGQRRAAARSPPRSRPRCAAPRSGRPPPAPPGGDHVYHQYVVTSGERDALREHLTARGIATGHPLPDDDPPVRRLRAAGRAARRRCPRPRRSPARSSRFRCTRC